MLKLRLKQALLFISLFLAWLLVFHNIAVYPTEHGYDFGLHSRYADILTSQWRLPNLTETREAYNPPLFYLVSGLFSRLAGRVAGLNFLMGLKAWLFFNTLLLTVSFYIWFKIIQSLFPQNKLIPYCCLGWLFSLPVMQKTIPMYTIETFFLLIVSVTCYYFIFKYSPAPDIKKTILLAILVSLSLLTRLSGPVVLVGIMTGIISLKWLKKISYKKTAKLLITFILIVFIGSGWFYFKPNKRIYDIKPNPIPLSEFISYFTDIPFHYMMTYPLRMPVVLKQFVPIYYSDFWGDWWNYYIQSRFNISRQARSQDKFISTPERISSLALQNQINLLPTILIIAGFVYLNINFIQALSQPKNKIWLVNTVFLSLTYSTWLGFIYMNVVHPSWDRDTIKACYMLYNLPIFVYFGTVFLFRVLKKYKIVFIPASLWLILATVVNFWWSWY